MPGKAFQVNITKMSNVKFLPYTLVLHCLPWTLSVSVKLIKLHENSWKGKELDHIEYLYLWVTFLAETSKDLEIILIIIVLSLTNRLSRTSLYLSLKTSFVYSNLFSLAKTVTTRCYIPV